MTDAVELDVQTVMSIILLWTEVALHACGPFLAGISNGLTVDILGAAH